MLISILILLSIISVYVLKRIGAPDKLVSSLRLWNIGLCMVLVLLNPWMLLPLVIMVIAVVMWIRHRGIPKRIGLWG